MKYFIHWKSKVTGQTGNGTLIFDKEKAEQICRELNEEFPAIVHEAMLVVDSSAKHAPAEQCEKNPKNDDTSERPKVPWIRGPVGPRPKQQPDNHNYSKQQGDAHAKT